MPQTKAMRRASVPVLRRPANIQLAIGLLAEARDRLRECGSKAAADYTARAMKSAEGAHRHAERMVHETARLSAAVRIANRGVRL